MQKPTKIFLYGSICAAIIGAAGFANTHRLDSKLRELVSVCKEYKTKNDPLLPKGFEITLECDPGELSQSEFQNPRQLEDIQRRVIATYKLMTVSTQVFVIGAVGTFGISVLPWAWYFLLNRIRELRDAITGKTL